MSIECEGARSIYERVADSPARYSRFVGREDRRLTRMSHLAQQWWPDNQPRLVWRGRWPESARCEDGRSGFSQFTRQRFVGIGSADVCA